ncbi:MAG: putative transcriptional regulator [Verrucomicrobia bacterium]|nr:putative transcriptional regulator [Verrucomicrobiota bacterium]
MVGRMSLQRIPLTSLTEAHLQALVSDGARESRDLEFKREWRLADDPDKREFLFDVSSFANAGGGDVVYGIDEEAGAASSVPGLAGLDFDGEQRRADALVMNWIEPRPRGLAYQTVPLASGRTALVVRISRSWSGPHRVTYGGANRFYSRNSANKYQLDVNELRQAFGAASSARDRLRDFRLERIDRIGRGEVETPLQGRNAVVIHLMPLAPPSSYDPKALLRLGAETFPPMGELHSVGPQINFESCMFKSTSNTGESYTYSQVFRNGAVEAVRMGGRSDETQMIYPRYEHDVRPALHRYATGLSLIGVLAPWLLALSHVNVRGFQMWEAQSVDAFRRSVPIAREHLLVPEVLIEQTDLGSLDQALKQVFDPVWNACGRLGSPHFAADGSWKEQ